MGADTDTEWTEAEWHAFLHGEEDAAPGSGLPRLVPVETEADFVAALLVVGELLDAEDAGSRAVLRAQSTLIADWQKRTAPPGPADAPVKPATLLATMRSRIKKKGLRRWELRRLFHGADWEVLSGRRPLSPAMMWDVSRALDIPMEVLVASRAPAPARHEKMRKPAVPIADSVSADRVVCLECGARRVYLIRHIEAAHGLDEWTYRARWGLLMFHPLTAPAYSARCARRAKRQGLGGDTRRLRREDGTGPGTTGGAA